MEILRARHIPAPYMNCVDWGFLPTLFNGNSYLQVHFGQSKCKYQCIVFGWCTQTVNANYESSRMRVFVLKANLNC